MSTSNLTHQAHLLCLPQTCLLLHYYSSDCNSDSFLHILPRHQIMLIRPLRYLLKFISPLPKPTTVIIKCLSIIWTISTVLPSSFSILYSKITGNITVSVSSPRSNYAFTSWYLCDELKISRLWCIMLCYDLAPNRPLIFIYCHSSLINSIATVIYFPFFEYIMPFKDPLYILEIPLAMLFLPFFTCP